MALDRAHPHQHPYRHLGRGCTLSALQESQPAGIYQVESDEEQLATISSPAYRRIATWLRLTAPAESRALDRLVNVDAAELESALAADAVQ